MGSVLSLAQQGLNKAFYYAQRDVTLRTKTITRDSNDDPIEVNSDTTIKSVVQRFRDFENKTDVGFFEPVELVAFVKPDISLDTSKYMVIDAVEYRITEVLSEQCEGTVVFRLAGLKKSQ
jgi:hypothetical protein